MEDLASIRKEVKKAVSGASAPEALENLRVSYLGKSGIISGKMRILGGLPPEQRKEFGAAVNKLRDEVSTLIEGKKASLEAEELNKKLASEKVDVTLPVRPEKEGKIHPISQVIDEVTAVFSSMGFSVAEGPEIEDDFHNFNALNIPPEHPARQMHDTFYFPEKDGERFLLRTHTSPVQIRYMENNKPPYRVIAPGRTYRCDSDMTHSPMFHQVEGLYIDKDVNMGHLKGCLKIFVEAFFGVRDVPVRFRPSFFPFTEPSAEMDIGCSREGGELKIGVGKDWLEILGCGMVHPNVLKNAGIDPTKWRGFAFGLGIERIAMLKYGIPDLRTFFDADERWLRHYGFAPLDIPTLARGLNR